MPIHATKPTARVAPTASWLVAASLAVVLWMVGTAAIARALEIRSIVLTVADLDRAVAFYEGALGFRTVAADIVADSRFDAISGLFGSRVRRATLQLGDERIELEQYLGPRGQPLPVDSRANDLWFQHFAIVVRDMDAAHAHLGRYPYQAISTAPQTIPESNAAAAGIRAFKFRDPDGHPLELLQFPPGKGSARWHAAGQALFMGIDHTAITVGATERSLRFWNELLGFSVAGGSLNSGPTQEYLDGAFGAVVRVTGLRPQRATGPGLEFLQYLAPSGGRSLAATAAINDVAHARVVLEVDDLDRLVDELTRVGAHFVSARPVALGGAPYARAMIVRDPDGHAVMLVEP